MPKFFEKIDKSVVEKPENEVREMLKPEHNFKVPKNTDTEPIFDKDTGAKIKDAPLAEMIVHKDKKGNIVGLECHYS